MINIQETNTIRNNLKWAIAALKNSDIEFPEADADTLLAHVLSCDRTNLYTNPDDVIDVADICKYKKLVNERASHVPLQYITGRAEFMSQDFVVDERVLIPRPETEILVETVLKKAHSDELFDKNITIVEIGTGSGNIAVSLAKYMSKVLIYTNDTSQDALAVACTNTQRHDVADKINLLHGDFFNVFYNCVEKKHVDFIVSNPPYVSESELSSLEPEIRDHEPHQALVGGEDGLCYIRKIIEEAAEWLRPGGYLILEIGETQANSIVKLIQNEMHYKETEKIKDLQGKERVISARRK